MTDIAYRLLAREVHPHFSDSIFREAAEEISRLRAALAPFASAMDGIPLSLPDQFEILIKIDAMPVATVKVGDFRNASTLSATARGGDA